MQEITSVEAKLIKEGGTSRYTNNLQDMLLHHISYLLELYNEIMLKGKLGQDSSHLSWFQYPLARALFVNC
jgi:hypothetical protein